MKNLVLCFTLNFLFFINTVYSTVLLVPVEKAISFTPKQTFKIACNVTWDETSGKPDIEWTKDNKPVTSIDDLKSRAKSKWDKEQNVLTIEKSVEGDYGNYTCIALRRNVNVESLEEARANIAVSRAIAVRVPTNINVVEEEKLRIECKVMGNPRLHWIFNNETYEVSRDRVTLENYTDDGRVIENGIFILDKVTKDDRGIITCVGTDLISNETLNSDCMIRVKDKYAALWPFLGICAEVIILCAIIVIYEKKRNKTELEESDTDQSPDQKNTPDHGKENLRHRQ